MQVLPGCLLCFSPAWGGLLCCYCCIMGEGNLRWVWVAANTSLCYDGSTSAWWPLILASTPTTRSCHTGQHNANFHLGCAGIFFQCRSAVVIWYVMLPEVMFSKLVDFREPDKKGGACDAAAGKKHHGMRQWYHSARRATAFLMKWGV